MTLLGSATFKALFQRSSIAQLAEQPAVNRQVLGSSPSRGATLLTPVYQHAVRSSTMHAPASCFSTPPLTRAGARCASCRLNC